MRNDQDRTENADLWEQLLDLCDRYDVEFRCTRGHAGIKDNERCDQLASEAARKKDLPVDAGYECAGR